MAGGLTAVMFVNPLRYATFPFREATRKAIVEGVKTAVKLAGKKGAWTMSNFAGAAAGPLIIITGAILVAQMELDKILQTNETEGKLRQAIDQATGTLNLAVLNEKDGGAGEIVTHWGAVVEGDTKPRNSFYAVFDTDAGTQDQTTTTGIQPSTGTSSATVNVTVSETPNYDDSPANQAIEVGDESTANASKVLWKQIKGSSAQDIAVAADGEVWIVGKKSKSSLGPIQYLNAKSDKWISADRNGRKIVAGMKADIWVWRNPRNIARYAGQNKKWKHIYAGGKKVTELSDIAVGPKGHAWAISFTEDDEGNKSYKIVKWSKGKWKSPGDGWKSSYGTPVRVAVTSKGNAG